MRGDAGRLRQIVQNLISNAIKFTERGSIRIHAALAHSGGGEHVLRFTVRDTGIGIGPEEREHLFQPFTQADGSSTRRHGGTGIGLAICKQLVGLMGGEIGVQSAPGEGSTFWFTVHVEAVEAEAALDELRPLLPRAPLPTPRPAERGRVLVVEDNAVNAKITVRLVEKLGYVAEAVSDGAQAVDAVRARDFDMILMDCQMPVMDGFDATSAIRDLDGDRASVPDRRPDRERRARRPRARARRGDGRLPDQAVRIKVLQDALERWCVPGGLER